jgi:hypothetical protein
MEAGRATRVPLPSFHILVTGMEIFSVGVLVIVKPEATLPVTIAINPAGTVSST